MSGKNTAVFGIYPTGVDAERAVDTLINQGFASGSISVLLPDVRSTHEFAHHKETKAPEGTAAGATAGGVIGGALGVLAGIGALAIPGVGPFIAAGPIMAGLAGLGVGGALGGIVGALVGMGIPEYEAKRYEGRVKDGGTLLSVHCDTSDQVSRAKDLLKSSGAQDIASTHESAGAQGPVTHGAVVTHGAGSVSGTAAERRVEALRESEIGSRTVRADLETPLADPTVRAPNAVDAVPPRIHR